MPTKGLSLNAGIQRFTFAMAAAVLAGALTVHASAARAVDESSDEAAPETTDQQGSDKKRSREVTTADKKDWWKEGTDSEGSLAQSSQSGSVDQSAAQQASAEETPAAQEQGSAAGEQATPQSSANVDQSAAQQASPEETPAAQEQGSAAGEQATPQSAETSGSPPNTSDVQTIPVPEHDEKEPLATEPTQLDTITVTAQKRGQQAIKDVPISMSVVDDQLIFDWAITDVREAMLFVPNVKVEQAGFFSSPRIRGFSFNNNNKAFEPPAGFAMDGINYGRVEYFAAAIFDINRIEVLRGPQGTTFGKNTTAGLLHVLSKDPTDTFEGYIDLQRGEFDRQRLEMGVGGPLIGDMVNIRIAALVDERRGFIENTTAALSEQAFQFMRGTDRSGVRAKLQFPDLFGTQLKISYESLELADTGTGVEIVRAGPAVRSTLLNYDPKTDFVPGNFVTSLDNRDGRSTDIKSSVAEWNAQFGTWGVTALGGYSLLKTALNVDVDFTPSPANYGIGFDSSPTSTAELRALSPSLDGLLGLSSLFGLDLGQSELLFGAYYQGTGIVDSELRFVFDNAKYLELTEAAAQDQNNAAAPPTPPPGGGGNDDVSQFFDSHGRTHALFGQLEWQFLPRWAAQLSGRYSEEKKDAAWMQVYNSPPPNALVQAAGLDEFTAERERTDSRFQPKVSLNYQPMEGVSLFGHWATAFKAGGYNAFAFRDVEEQLVYKPEYSNELGLDAKMSLLDRTMNFNVSLYRQDINDFQVLTRLPQQDTVGLGITIIENAPKARAQGVEADLTWLSPLYTRFMLTLGYNDTEYIDHPFNDCPADMRNTDGDGDPRCSANGRPFAFAPKLNGVINAIVTPPWIVQGVGFSVGVTAEYQTEQYLDIDLDERKVDPTYWRYRASLGFSGMSEGWSFKIIGENLTNQVSYIRQGDVFAGVFVGVQEPPRQIFGQLRWTF